MPTNRSLTILALSAVLAAGCTIQEGPAPAAPAPEYAPAPAAAPAPATVVSAPPAYQVEGQAAGEYDVVSAPPAPMADPMGPAPSAGHVWVQGRWVWRANGWTWIHGHWQPRPVGHEHWVAGRWEHVHSNRYRWVPGHWQ
ncbi:MAG: hypothetical protein ACXVEF_40550 [Polyangiales bacterium]